MTNLLIAVTAACLGVLSIQEIVRYARARMDLESLPYPRRRLARRLGVAVLFEAILGLLWAWPARPSPKLALGLLAATGVLFILALLVLMRDLHETSLAMVVASEEMSRRTAGEMKNLLKRSRAAGEKNKQDAPDKTES
jgi:hypothetical protein